MMTNQTAMNARTIRNVRFFNGLDMDSLTLLHRAGARKEDLLRLFARHGATVEYVGADCLRLQVGEDSWQLCLQDGVPALYHNAYRILDDGSRVLLGTYHRQNDGGDAGFAHLADLMCTYSFEKHVEAARRYEARAAAERLEGLLAITENYTDAGWRSLFFRWYTFVDIGQRSRRHLRRFGVSSLREESRTERGDYALVTCRVLRMQRRGFERLMAWTKSMALRERRQDYAEVCREKLPQVE